MLASSDDNLVKRIKQQEDLQLVRPQNSANAKKCHLLFEAELNQHSNHFNTITSRVFVHLTDMALFLYQDRERFDRHPFSPKLLIPAAEIAAVNIARWESKVPVFLFSSL